MEGIVELLKGFDLHTILSIIAIVWFFSVRQEKKFDTKLDHKFEAMDKKFEAKIEAMDKKFEAKFDAMDKKFENLDRKFEIKFDFLENKFDTKFDFLEKKIDSNTIELKEINGNLNEIDSLTTNFSCTAL